MTQETKQVVDVNLNGQPQGDTPTPQAKSQTITEQPAVDTPPKDSVENPSAALKNDLEREKARAATAQQEADRLRKELRSIQQQRQSQSTVENEAETTETNVAQSSVVNERTELERGVFKLMLDNPDFKGVLESDSTLKNFFEKDPLAITNDPINVDDALYQIKRFFEDKVYESKKNEVELRPETDELTARQVPHIGGSKKAPSADDFDRLSSEEQDALLEKSLTEGTW